MSDNRTPTPVAANTRSNNPILITGDGSGSPLPCCTLIERGDSGETKDNNKETKDNTTDPPPPPPQQAEVYSDWDNDSIMSDTKTDFLKYLAPKYKKFKAIPDLSDVITLERKLGTSLWSIANKYKDGGWSYVVDDDDTHKVRLGITGAYTAPVVPTRPDPGDNTLSKRQFNEQQAEFHDYCICTVQCLKLLETVFIILKRKYTPLGNYKPDFTVKKAFEYLKTCYVDNKEKRKAAFILDQEVKEMTYTHTLQGPNKYFEDLNEKFLRLEHLKFLKIDDDNDKKTIAENAFEQVVPPIAMNEINAKWKQEANQTWETYQDFWTNELRVAFCDNGVKEQQLAS